MKPSMPVIGPPDLPVGQSGAQQISIDRDDKSIALLEQSILDRLNTRPDLDVKSFVDILLADIEDTYPGVLCSILKLSPENNLLHYSAPHLPQAYTSLIKDIKPGPNTGSCGTAVYYDKPVIVADIASDPLWEGYRDMAISFGLHACWSVPIHYSDGSMMGVFGIYHRQPSTPSESMRASIGRLAKLIGLIIENRETIDSLRLSNERNNLASMATHDMIWDWDLQKNEIFRNEEGLKNIYGFSNNDPIRQVSDWVSRIHPDDKDRVEREIQDVLHGTKKHVFQAEYRFLKGDGTYAYIDDRGHIMLDAAGNPFRAIGAAQDITARVNAEKLTRDSEERYRYLFQANPLPMWIFDLETLKFLEVNHMTVQHYGYTPEEFREMTIFDIRPESEHPRLAQLIAQEKSERKVYVYGKWQHRKKNGELIYVNTFSHMIEYNERIAMLIIAHDITQNILLQDELINEKNARQKEVMEATIGAQEKERNEIGYELHDNINQILTSAKLYVECIGRDDDLKESYRSTAIKLLLDAIEELRRISKSLVSPRIRDIGFIRAVTDIMNNLAAACKIEVGFDHKNFDERLIDEHFALTLYRIIQEQITNVSKHANASNFHIRISMKDDFVELLLSDDGVGYDPSAFKKGIGLTNITNRAAMHQGVVSVDSAPGKGFSLRVRFEYGLKSDHM